MLHNILNGQKHSYLTGSATSVLSVARAKLYYGVDDSFEHALAFVKSIGFAWLVSCVVGLFARTTVQMLKAMPERIVEYCISKDKIRITSDQKGNYYYFSFRALFALRKFQLIESQNAHYLIALYYSIHS